MQYLVDSDKFFDDVMLIFKNAQNYYRQNTVIGKNAEKIRPICSNIFKSHEAYLKR